MDRFGLLNIGPNNRDLIPSLGALIGDFWKIPILEVKGLFWFVNIYLWSLESKTPENGHV